LTTLLFGASFLCAAGVRRTERILYSLELRRSGKHTKFSFIISLLILRKSQAKNLVGHKLNVIKSITRPQEFLNTSITRPHSNLKSIYYPLSSFANCEQTTSKYSQFENKISQFAKNFSQNAKKRSQTILNLRKLILSLTKFRKLRKLLHRPLSHFAKIFSQIENKTTSIILKLRNFSKCEKCANW